MDARTVLLLVLGALLAGATCGFFLTWTIAVLPGLDQAGPEAAVAGMTAINRAVLNPVFALIFGGTPLALAAGVVACAARRSWPTAALAAAALVVLVLGVHLVTFAASIPLNEALAHADGADAATAWEAFSGPWQQWNAVRALAATAALALELAALALAAGARVP